MFNELQEMTAHEQAEHGDEKGELSGLGTPAHSHLHVHAYAQVCDVYRGAGVCVGGVFLSVCLPLGRCLLG